MQLQNAKRLKTNLKDKKKDDWLKVAEKRWKADKKNQEQYAEDEWEQRLPTNNEDFAPEAVREIMKNKKESTDYYTEALKLRDKLFKYMPPKQNSKNAF
jgi:hypothetical protein